MKTVSALILLVAASLSMAAQTYPSKEYVRLGSRVMAIEAPPTLLPSGESAAANNGETGTPIQITGSPNSSWSASTGAGAITLGATMGMTDSAGVATITYNLAGNAQQTAFTGYILVTMESGTAVYNITQLCCWSDSVTLTPTSANAPAKASNGSVTVGTASNNVSWTVTPQSCFNNSVSPLMGTGGGVISYSLVANTSTNPQTCSFTVAASGGGNSQTFTVTQAGAPGLSESNPTLTLTGPGTYSATVTADGVYTVNVLNWTGWQVTVTAGGAGGWLSTQNITSSSAQYKISGGAGTGTLTFTDGTTTLTLNVTESTSGGSCSSTPTLSLNKSSMSFTAAGGSGQQTSTYSATITSNTNWTASCSNADQEGLTFYVSGNSNTGICTVPLTGSGNQTLYVDLTYNHANPPTALSTTLNVTTCGGSAAKSANITVSQGAETFTVTPGTQTIYQDFDNAPTQFTAYFDGGLPLPTGYSVAWSLSDSSGNSGTINSSGLYLPPNPVPTNFGSVTVTARLSDGSTATAVVSVQANPYAPQASVSPTGQTGSGTVFQFEFNTADGDDPPGTAAINNATMLFSTTATAGTQTPSLAGCYMYIFPGYGVNDSEFELSGQAAYVSTTFPGSTWSKSALWNSDCSVNLAGTESTLYTWATTNGTATSPLFANIPIQFYEGDAGLTGIWATQLENGNTTTYNLFLGNYTVASPTETVSPSSVTLNASGQTQQFTGLAAGTTPIPDAVWNTPSAGTISSTGLYTAPNTLTTSQTVSISGKRSSDSSSICCATVVLSPVSVSVSPQSVSLSAGQTQNVTATVNGTSNQGVTWNTPSAGTFSNGVYTAPSSIASQQTVTLTATSTVDTTKSASVTITLMPVAVSLAPTSVSLEINQTQNFTATVTGTTTQTVTWSLSPSGAASGSVSSAGLYTAPTSIPTAKTVTITATSTVDSTKSASSQVSLIADALAISPTSASLAQGQNQQFTATVTGATNSAVNWSMTPTGFGTLSTGGYYTAPGSITTQQTVVVTATSQADASLAKSVNVVLNPLATVAASAGTPQSAAISTAFATPLQVTVLNTSNSPLTGVTVTFTAPSSGASATFGGLATATATTNSSGVAAAPTLTANTTAGTYTVTANVAGATTPASFSLTNAAGPPASIAASAGTPQSVTIGTAFPTVLQATVKDASNNPVSGATVTFTAPGSGASAAFGGSATATATTNSSGVATAPTLTANTTAGSYAVTGSVSGVATSANFSLTNTTGPPASITSTTGTPQSATISTAFAAALQATVKDSGGNLVSGTTVTFTAPSSGSSAAFGSSSTATATTNSSGVATAPTLTANSTGGTYTVTASVSGVGTSASFSLTNNDGAPANITASAGTPQSTTISTAFATTLQTTVKDSGGNLLNGVAVTFTAPSSGARATFAGSATATATTNSSGVATAQALTANATAGSYTVTASVSGLGTSASFSLTNNTGPPASITANAGTPQSAIITAAFATALQATVKDSGGNPVSGVTVTFTAPNSGASAAFGGSATATAATNSSGVATAPTLTANATVGSYTVTASVSGVTTSASFSLTNNNPAPTLVTLTSGTSWTAPVGVTSMQVECVGGGGGGYPDGGASNGGGGGAYARRSAMAVTPGNIYSYTIGAGGSGSAVTNGGATTFTGDGGVQCIAAAGKASGAGGTTARSTGDVVFAGGAGFSSGGTYGGGGGGSGGSASNGNTGNGSTGATAVTGGGPGGNGGATANANGNSPVSGPGGGGGGCYNTTGCNGGNGFAGQIKLTYTSALSPGIAASIAATAGTPQSAGFATAFATGLQATVLDIANNPVSGLTVTFTAPSSGATATFAGSATATATTNSSGVATAPTLTANTTLGSYIVTANVSSVPTSASFSLTNTVLTLTSGATWTAPAGVTSIQVECVGGGGGGYGNSGDNNGGGGGAYARRNAMAVTPGNIYSYTIGAGGSADTNGGTTTFTGDGGVQCVAAAGKSSGGGGTTARSTGDVVFAGGAGFSSGGSFGGGGGGSGGSASAGNTSSGSPGGAAVTGGGPGGNGATNANGSSPVSGPGGGGGGSYFTSGSYSGGNGANGQVTITIE